jgi:PST family polysaccharide transporter
VFLGPSGLGVISQFMTFIGLITSTVHIGSPFSLSAILPSLFKEDEIDSKQKIYSYFRFFIKLFGIITVIVSSIIIIFSSPITDILLDSNENSLILRIIAISIPFTVLYAIFESFLRSSGQINRMVRVSIYSNIIAIPALFILIQMLSINGIAIYLVLVGLIPFVIMLILYRKVFSPDYHIYKTKLCKQDIKNVFKTGFTSLLAFLFYQLVVLYLRKFIISNFGFEANGLYQSVFGLSLNIFAFMYSFLGNHTLPQLSMHKENDKVVSILDDTSKFLILIIIPILLLLFSFREIILVVFYSKSFISAGNLILFQFIGDFFRIFASLFSIWLFSRMKIKQLIVIDLIFNALLLTFPQILIKLYPNDLRIVPFSYMLASFIQFTLFFAYTKKTLNFKFCVKTHQTLILSLVILTASMIISSIFIYTGYFVSWIFLFAWGYIYLNFIEKISISDTIAKLFQKYS